ncbi:hypothetical protein HDV01_004440, partial [Terramyces sp. JEL0728]
MFVTCIAFTSLTIVFSVLNEQLILPFMYTSIYTYILYHYTKITTITNRNMVLLLLVVLVSFGLNVYFINPWLIIQQHLVSVLYMTIMFGALWVKKQDGVLYTIYQHELVYYVAYTWVELLFMGLQLVFNHLEVGLFYSLTPTIFFMFNTAMIKKERKSTLIIIQ